MKICPVCKAEYAGGEVFCPVDAARLSEPSDGAASKASRTDSPSDALVGSTLGERYRIIRRIGEGGMGIVYEALHVVIEKRVALKVLRSDFSSRPEVVERFRQEAKSASRIGHEHIVDISDFGETPSGQSYFVMEFLEGEDLANVLARESTLAPDRALRIVKQCCRALGAAHAKGIVHRDMKPENIFLVRRTEGDDFVKIVDFGIAKMSDIETEGAPGRKLTKTGTIFGTPEYMSPEQAAGKELDHRVDIYALGVILFEMITGRVPFVGDSFMGILTQHMFEDVPHPRDVNPNVFLSESVEHILDRALAKAPDERFQTMDELSMALAEPDANDRAETLVGVRAPREAVTGRWEPETQRKASGPSRSILGAVFAVAVLGAGGAAWLAMRSEPSVESDAVESATPTRLGQAPADVEPSGTASPTSSNTTETAPGREGGSGSADEAAARATGESGDGSETTKGPSGAASATDAAGDDDAAAERIAIEVKTEPPGATVRVAGRGEVCAPTPCSFEADSGERVRLRAARGRYVGTRSWTPETSSTVELELRPRRRPRGSQGAGGGGGSPGVGDLKHPDIFKD
jgi:serine/threonine-protein kinase